MSPLNMNGLRIAHIQILQKRNSILTSVLVVHLAMFMISMFDWLNRRMLGIWQMSMEVG